MITVSETARRKIELLMAEQGKTLQETFIRVGVKGGGCSGISYVLSFDQSLGESD